MPKFIASGKLEDGIEITVSIVDLSAFINEIPNRVILVDGPDGKMWVQKGLIVWTFIQQYVVV